MEQTDDIFTLLEQMDRPAFCVKEGVILYANAEAQKHMLCEGTPITPLLATGQQEYAQLEDGCLCLSLRLMEVPCSASVTRMAQFDLFALDQDREQSDLQAMALAAQELRQPLSSVMSVADRLFPISGIRPEPALQEQVARINRGLFQMLRIVSNMSDAFRYSRETASRQELRDMNAFFREIFTAMEPLVAHTGVSLQFTGLDQKLYSLADEEKLERAVGNMISNAVKHTPKGGTVEASLKLRGNMLYLTVKDSGRGIPEQLRGTVYSRYRRSPGIEDGDTGIGLGMVLIRSAATLHGGTVLIRQSPEGGSQVTMTLRIRQDVDSYVRSSRLRLDYAGEQDHRLIELSDILPYQAYQKEEDI